MKPEYFVFIHNMKDSLLGLTVFSMWNLKCIVFNYALSKNRGLTI